MPAETTVSVPEVRVLRVKAPLVTETLEAPDPSMEKAPEDNMSKVPVTSTSRLAPAFRSIKPADVAMRDPDEVVLRVRFALATVKFEAAEASKLMASEPETSKSPFVESVTTVFPPS